MYICKQKFESIRFPILCDIKKNLKKSTRLEMFRTFSLHQVANSGGGGTSVKLAEQGSQNEFTID